MSGFDFGDLGSLDWANGVQSSTGETWSVPGSTIPINPSVGELYTNFSAGPATGLSGLWDNFTGQLGQIGQNAIKNPLGALAAGLGAYGTYRENTGGKIPEGTIDAVDQLSLKGDLQNAWKPEPVQYKTPVARDSRHYIQSYDLEGNHDNRSRNAAHVSDTYKSVLGREADAGGARFWEDVMNNKGMRPDQLWETMKDSPEFMVNRAYEQALGRRSDFDGGNYWQGVVKEHGLGLHDLKNTFGNSDEAAIKSTYNSALGRPADEDGLEYWYHQLRNGANREDVLANIRNSPEALKRAAPQPAPAPAPVGGGLTQANPAPGVPTAVAPRPGKIFMGDQYTQYLE